ncbi:MAG TPA: response regulator [Nitrososphaeraceae archaeon]|nr:response regulator [Nitrososphaeraceae archaeon]
MWHHSNKGNKSIKFTDDSLKCCVCFIEFQTAVNNLSLTYDSSQIREYYSTVINSLSQIIKRNNGKIVKSLGDRLLCYFLNFSDINNEKAFEEVIECVLEILEKREDINQELLLKNNLPPLESYKISLDYGVVDLALAGDNYQIDIFGSAVNICSKINSSPSLAPQNEIIIGNNFYRILKSFSNIVNKYNFINNGEFKVTENIGYPTYNIKRRSNTLLQKDDTNSTHSLTEKQLNSFVEDSREDKNKKRSFFFHKKNKNKRIIIVDDDEDILFTYRIFLKDYDYHITCFTEPTLALNYIREISNFDDLLIILDIRMKILNGIQLHQQIKSIDPTIKIVFITALDILDELLSIIPGISKEQIMRKPVDKNLFAYTVKNMLNN